MNQKVVIEANKEDLLQALREFREEEIKEKITEKWSARTVSAEVFCQIHDISLRTLYRYIDEGRVIPNEREGRKLNFQLSYVLSLDLGKFKRAPLLKSKIHHQHAK